MAEYRDFFSKSKSTCADSSGSSHDFALYGRRCAARKKGKLCFIKRKGKLFVLSIRGFYEKKFCFLGMRRRENENLWTFLRNSSSFLSFLPPFSCRPSVFSSFPLLPLSFFRTVPPRVRRCASADTHPRIAPSASSQFLPSPFTFTPNSLTTCDLRAKVFAFFCLHW